MNNTSYDLSDVHMLMNMIHFYKREIVLAKYSSNSADNDKTLEQLVGELQQEFKLFKAEYEQLKRESVK